MNMQILSRFCLLIVACSALEVQKRFLQICLGLFLMDCASFFKSSSLCCDFGCGFLAFGCFPQVFNLFGLILVVFLGLKVLQFSCYGKSFVQLLSEIRGKSSRIRNGLGSKIGFGEEFDAKILSCICGPLKLLENSKSRNLVSSFKSEKNQIVGDLDDEREREGSEEDEEFDVMALGKLVKSERQRADKALMELEMERMAAASAADEAMALVLRLQIEKSAIELEATQYRRLAEQKQEYDKYVIQSLEWILMNHESERRLLDKKLKLYRQKLKQYMKDGNDDDDDGNELEQFNIEDDNYS